MKPLKSTNIDAVGYEHATKTRGKAKDEAAALSNWAGGFTGGAEPVKAETTPITRHTS